jgi:hypothetical protein
VLAGEGQGPEFAGVEGARVRYSSGVHSILHFCGPEPGSAGTLAGLNG